MPVASRSPGCVQNCLLGVLGACPLQKKSLAHDRALSYAHRDALLGMTIR